MGIELKEVLTKKDLWAWVRFPNKLYKDNEFFVPFLENDEFETFSQNKNPAYAYCETRLFLAYKDGEVAGRIAGLINNAYNQKWNKNAIRFTRFDFIDDYEVSKALFDAVVNWGKQKNYTEIMGPIGFHDIDHEGMLVEGFDKLNMSITFYNHPYYLTHMEKLGLQKDIDWIEYKITVPETVDPRFERIANSLIKKENYKVVTYTDRKVLYKDAFEAFELIDEAYSKLYGTVPLTQDIIRSTIDAYIPLVNLDYICAIKDNQNKIVSFGIMVPSIAKALKKSNGKMFPFGIVRMLRALQGKNDTLEMFLVAVNPELQARGLPALLINELLKKSIKNNVKYCETGPMLETNTKIHSLWRHFDKEQHKRRRCFIKQI
ncbi:MAG: N-acetyltransferase [Clostridia bacterium]|nr:N-acetyltransferase [Clostridia bacterium]